MYERPIIFVVIVFVVNITPVHTTTTGFRSRFLLLHNSFLPLDLTPDTLSFQESFSSFWYNFSLLYLNTAMMWKLRRVELRRVELLLKLHLRATECRHVGSHNVTWHPTQVNTPALTSATGWYSIYLPRRDGRLSWPRWLVTYRDGLPARRWSLWSPI